MRVSCSLIILAKILMVFKSVRGTEVIEGSQPSLPTAQWGVQPKAQNGPNLPHSGHCLLLSGNFSVIFVHKNENPEFMSEDMRRLHFSIEVPQEAEANGHCEEQQSEVYLRWLEDSNLLNLVVSKNGRLASLTGVFVRLHHQGRRYELTSNINTRQKSTLSWPFRYCLSCKKTLYYPLYKVGPPANIQQQHQEKQTDFKDPEAFIVLENLMMEVFGEETPVESLLPELKSKQFHRRSWGCEFHHILDWAPVVVGSTLLVLVAAMISSFFFKSYLGCSDYQRKRGYQKI